MDKKPITWYVIEPRDEACYRVNPRLWEEFTKLKGKISNNLEIYTEAYCVQYLDRYYENSEYTEEMEHTVSM